MIDYNKKILENGLTVIVHRHPISRMAAVNMLYKVGARNEDPEHTGFAHLFEHLMFRGTRNVPDFDTHIQLACGENNAFTNNDYTNYYITLPKDNIETALWLESDRMQGLNINARNLNAEKKVVIEEFNQRYLNQPYGDMWMQLRDIAYKEHPYRWATIGLSPEHIAKASLAEVKEFYEKFYAPSNAILSIAADMPEQEMLDLAHKWFGNVPSRHTQMQQIAPEPKQENAVRREIAKKVPATLLTIAFKMSDRLSPEFYHADLISDILSGGTSARLHQNLVKTHRIFESIDAHVTGDIDAGLFVITGHLLNGITKERAEQAIWHELERLKSETADEYELEKVKNKFEANTIFGEINVMNRAMNLGFYEMLGNLPLINDEVSVFRSITGDDIRRTANKIFVEQSSSTLIYIPADEKE